MILDLRAALRAFARSPSFVAGAVLTLAVALGLLTVAVGLLFGALGPVGVASDVDPVVLYLTEQVDGRTERSRWPYAAIERLRLQSKTLDRIASYTTATLNLSTVSADGQRLDVELISPAYLEILGIRPALGREAERGAGDRLVGPDEILISDALWRQTFGATADALGRTVRLSRRPVTIVGVLPPGFKGLTGRADILVPHTLAPVVSFAGYFTSDEYFHNVIGRRAPGVAMEEARSELAVIATSLVDALPPRSANAVARSAEIARLHDAQTDAQSIRLRLLITGGALLVLLIAAVNIANLVLTRVLARQREFAVRLAVGASRGQVFRSVAVEMTLVTLAGLVAALLVASWASDLVATLIPAGIANPANDYGQLATFAGLQLDVPVVTSIGALALATMVLVSVLACRPILRRQLADVMKLRGSQSTLGQGRTARWLLATQVAVSLALLAASGLLFRTVAALGDVEPGFNAERVVAFSVAEDLAAQQPAAGPILVERLLEAVRRVAGVQHATVGQCTPYGSRCARLELKIPGDPATETAPPAVGWHRVGPDHFAALGVPVLRGRGFTADDRMGRAPVVVINAEAARRFFPDRDPIGQRVRLPDFIPGEPDIAEIVGVVGNVVYWPLSEPPGPDVYQPALQFSYPWTTVMVRTVHAPEASIPALRAAIREMDPNLPLYNIVTLQDLARAGRADRRFLAVLVAVCAGLALLLATIGVYAMTASWMAGRRRELAVHVALGAEPASLVRLVMGATLTQTLVGTGIGLLLALGAGRLLRSMLFGVDGRDPRTLLIAASTMLAVNLCAAYLPARRALKVDPVHELNSE
jgi:putative ABC transport system permease protein